MLAGCSLQDEYDSGWHPERDPHATGNTLTGYCNSNSIRNWYLHLEWNPHATGGAHM